jgi:hypothetical protein
MNLVRIVSPYFVAGLEEDGTVRRAAPIIKYMVGWDIAKVYRYVLKKEWEATII